VPIYQALEKVNGIVEDLNWEVFKEVCPCPCPLSFFPPWKCTAMSCLSCVDGLNQWLAHPKPTNPSPPSHEHPDADRAGGAGRGLLHHPRGRPPALHPLDGEPHDGSVFWWCLLVEIDICAPEDTTIPPN
jgi:hypothetical protein